MLGEGLLIAEGKTWKQQRRTLAPAFAPRAIAPLVTTTTSVPDGSRRNTVSPSLFQIGTPSVHQ